MTIHKTISGSGTDVVVIHGWSCDSRYMEPVVTELTKKYRVTNIDLPGCGKSLWDESIKNIHDIADLIKPYLPQNAIFVPWSFGGLVTISLASRYPEYVNRIVGFGTTPKFIADKNWLGVPQPGFKASFNAEIEKVGYKKFFQSFIDNEFNLKIKPKEYYKVSELLQNGNDPDNAVLFSGVNICDASDLRSEFSKLNCEIDLIWGEKDQSVLLDSRLAVKSLNNNVNLHVIPDAQHMMFWTHFEDVKQVLKNIL